MNVSITYRAHIEDGVLDELAGQLPVIIAKVLEVPGGNLARLKPDQISLSFSQASPRDTGADIRIIAFAKSNFARKSTENDLAHQILEKVTDVTGTSAQKCSVNIRLYLMEIGTAEQSA
ncbi:hypothetical protein [Geobacter sp. SVR]|uniref:hypothetical protein n=1 Tax=Geobacter sp. SVR TaxID=2495594 RepID=UPI00143EFC22|nr:hypothetical protein [Geobacter sp. SVR]BCS54353.1 hypothetical protein GSVR_26610 [Geobacter sp. SVR]GCF87478.1 hypothetical protein GSbR_40780 [Geobacter sp. SVR]